MQHKYNESVSIHPKEAFELYSGSKSDYVYIINKDLTFRYISDNLADFFGVDSEAIVGKPASIVFDDSLLTQKQMKECKWVLENGTNMLNTVDILSKTNEEKKYYLSSKYVILGKDSEIEAVLCVSRNITYEFEAQMDYVSELEYLMRLNDDCYGAVLVDFTSWEIAEVKAQDRQHEAIIQFGSIEEYRKKVLETSDNSEDIKRFLESLSYSWIKSVFKEGKRFLNYEYNRILPDGNHNWVNLYGRLITNPADGHLMGIFVLTDINNIKTAERDLVKAAEIDSMTGVLNHDATLGHINRYMTVDGADGMHALIMVDRDGLKRINDTLGHQVGDEIIIETANVLRSVFRDSDIVGRVGGDEFLVLMKNVGKVQTVRRKAGELLQSLQCICGPAENAVESTGSIGISLYTGDNKTLDKLYAEADAALYRAKSEGKNRFMLYQSDSDDGIIGSDARDSLSDTVNLRTLLNSIDGGILILHTEPGKALSPVFFSDSFLTMMGGLTQDEAFSLYGEDMFECIHPDERDRVRQEYAEALESGEPLRTTYRLRGKEGDYHWLSAGTNITKNHDGKIDVYAVHTNIEKLMHREEKLASDEQRFRMAFAQTSRILCDVDIVNDTVAFYIRDGRRHIPESVISGLPDAIINSGFILEESGEAFRAFYAEMKSGKEEDHGLFKCRYLSSNINGWVSFTYQVVFNSDGDPYKAIGSIEELPHISRNQERLKRELFLMKNIGDELMVTIKANLTTDTIDYYNASDDFLGEGREYGHYSEFIDSMSDAVSYPEDVLILQFNVSKDKLLESYSSGKHWTSAEYRREDEGEIRWTKITVSLIENSVTREVYAFVYVSDVEKRRSVEVLLPVAVERDPGTHLYTQGTVEKLIDSMLLNANSAEKKYSIAIIRMLGLPEMSARIGAEKVDQEKMYLCRFLCVMLDSDCIVGRYNGDNVLVFCPDAGSDELMHKRIESIVSRLSEIHDNINEGEEIRLICGISTESAASANLAGMLSQANYVCEKYQKSETHKVYTFEQYVDSFKIPEESFERAAFFIVPHDELERPLLGVERHAMNECMSVMLAADHFDASINGAFGIIGDFYKAQRVYSISLINDNNSVSGLHEWAADGKHYTLHQLSGMPIAKLPLFKRALVASKPVILDGKGIRSTEGRKESEPSWCFITLPIINEGKVIGFVCIENPKDHKTSVVLPYKLIPLLMHERKRFNLNANGLRISGRDELTNLPDRSAYEYAMKSFNPDAYHSVGVIYIYAINLSELNREKGTEYVDDMLVFVANTLSKVCKKSQIYRISGTEFVVICTNMSREAFQAQGARGSSVLQRRYQRCFGFGDAWSDKGAPARKLLIEAETFARDSNVKPSLPLINKTGRIKSDINEIKEGFNEGRFFIYLQPQVNMRTGQVTGAEALARYRDSEGRMILPGEFVPVFEEAGIIRDLDYFVMEKTFQALQDWIKGGHKVVPISVNFSRQTMMSPTVMASALAIRSRFDVPENLVEIEVTESVSSYDTDHLRNLMDAMNQQGFRFALDDLGSEYSSLKTLGELSFDTIKLDKSLISNFLYNSMSRSVVESIVGLCGKNNIRCLAEGVETEVHATGLMEVGCVYAQGFYYGKPMPVDDFYKKYILK